MSNGLNRIDELDEVQQLRAELASAQAENTILRGMAAKQMPCHYCGVDEISKCPHGFPGCGLMDDLMATEEFSAEQIREMRSSLASLRAENEALRSNAEALRAQLHTMSDNYAGAMKERDELKQARDDIFKAVEFYIVPHIDLKSGPVNIMFRFMEEKLTAAEARANEAEAERDNLRKQFDLAKHFYTVRWDALQKLQRKLPEPYRTKVCNILANGKEDPFDVPVPTAGTGNGDEAGGER